MSFLTDGSTSEYPEKEIVTFSPLICWTKYASTFEIITKICVQMALKIWTGWSPFSTLYELITETISQHSSYEERSF